MKCCQCTADAVYELKLMTGEIIHVCEDCDENYSLCNVCGLADLDCEMRFLTDEDEHKTCLHCEEKIRYTRILELKDDVYRHMAEVIPSYYHELPEWFYNEITDDVAATSAFEDDGIYSLTDISLAFQRVILNCIRSAE